MGEYLVPGAKSITEVSQFALPAGGSTMDVTEGGVLVRDPTRSTAELAALYAGFVASGMDDDTFRSQLPSILRTHANHLRDYRDAIRAGTPVTTAQTTHVIADIIDWIRLTEPRL